MEYSMPHFCSVLHTFAYPRSMKTTKDREGYSIFENECLIRPESKRFYLKVLYVIVWFLLSVSFTPYVDILNVMFAVSMLVVILYGLLRGRNARLLFVMVFMIFKK